MNVGQNLSAIVNSPELAAVNLQAVTAGEFAERQLAATERQEARRRESQVVGTEQPSGTGGVEPREPGQPFDGQSARRRGRTRAAVGTQGAETSPQDPASGPEPGPGSEHRIDLVA